MSELSSPAHAAGRAVGHGGRMGRRTPAGYAAPRRQPPIWVVTIIGFGIGFCIGGLLIVGFLTYVNDVLSQWAGNP
jgi:hypothetical protein